MPGGYGPVHRPHCNGLHFECGTAFIVYGVYSGGHRGGVLLHILVKAQLHYHHPQAECHCACSPCPEGRNAPVNINNRLLYLENSNYSAFGYFLRNNRRNSIFALRIKVGLSRSNLCYRRHIHSGYFAYNRCISFKNALLLYNRGSPLRQQAFHMEAAFDSYRQHQPQYQQHPHCILHFG